MVSGGGVQPGGAFLGGVLAHRAPGGEGHVRAVETLRRGVGLVDHPGVLGGEQAVEEPPDEAEVLGLEEQAADARVEVDHQAHVAVVLGVVRHVELVVDEVGVDDAQHTRQRHRDEAGEVLGGDLRVRGPGVAGVADRLRTVGRRLDPEPALPLRGPGAVAGELGGPVLLGLHPEQPPAALLQRGEVPHRHRLEPAPHRVAVQELGVALVEAVLAGQSPVALAHLDPAAEVERGAPQFLGDLVEQRGGLLAVRAHVDPDQIEVLLDGVGRHRHLAADRRVGAVGDHRAEPAGGRVEGPAVVGAADGAVELLAAARQRHPAVRAAVVQSVQAVRVADQDDVLPAQGDPDRAALGDVAGPGHRVPVAAEAELRRVVRGPGCPGLTTGIAGLAALLLLAGVAHPLRGSVRLPPLPCGSVRLPPLPCGSVRLHCHVWSPRGRTPTWSVLRRLPNGGGAASIARAGGNWPVAGSDE
ncbi:hypothetical protein SDC9_103181 [bioreactor metagenome]|uniref:Uncharacterized protein n=1 Tax=bioreactor metagenome TaxID=1076179 RepID=A0A645ATH2_9ZZZZ